jgi:hypothetical protein
VSKQQTPEQVAIQPIGGVRVRKPNGQLLEPAGEPVTWNSYWLRRELDGDIERKPEKPKRPGAKLAISADTSE